MPIAERRPPYYELLSCAKAAARDALKDAIEVGDADRLRSAIEEGEDAGLDENELEPARRALAKEVQFIVIRVNLCDWHCDSWHFQVNYLLFNSVVINI